MNILVAEDNEMNRELLREALTSRGHRVLETPDGAQTLAQLERAQPDLLLLDIQMPGLDGYEVIRRIRADQRYSCLKVVAVTAYAMRGEREKAIAAGFNGYISKPVSLAALSQLIEEITVE